MIGADAPLLVYQSAHDHPLLAVGASVGMESRAVPMRWTRSTLQRRSGLRCVHRRGSEDACARCVPIRFVSATSTALDASTSRFRRTRPSSTLARLLEHADRVAELHRATRRDVLDSAVRRARTHQLADIGIALSAQRDPVKLLETLLTQARELADCDAGSLYLIEETAGVRSLHFKLAQNDTASVPFKEARLPLTTDSLSGYVALTGNELCDCRCVSDRCVGAVFVQSFVRRTGRLPNAIAARACRCAITKDA